jgi:hypothetical protein
MDAVGDATWDAYARLSGTAPPPPPLRARAAPFPAPEAIPPREWLLGTRLVRRFVSLLVTPGGVGKSALALASAASLACGRNILNEHVHHSVPAWVLNLEDPADEVHRRLAALMRLHGIADAELHGRLFLHHGRERRVVLAESQGFGAVAYPDRDAVAEEARAHGIGLIVVDPFVKSHGLDENDNVQMDAAATAWAEVADRAGAAVLLVHHTRKSGANSAEGGAEAARGAKSLTDAARSASLLAAMTLAEAEQLGVAPADRWRHVRLDDAKANLAPLSAARWFRLATVGLGNATPAYPHGDQVAAIEPWRPASPWAAHSPADLNRVLDQIAAGPAPGCRYAPSRRGRASSRWVGCVLMRELGKAEGQAARMVETWLKTGLLVASAYHDAEQRRVRMGVTVDDRRRPTSSPTAQENAHDLSN